MAPSERRGRKPGETLPGASGRAEPAGDTLTLIRTSFPGRDELITSAFRENRSFRELCRDYRRCVAALHRWRSLEAALPRTRGQEYSELLVELGSEIQNWLQALDTGPARRNGGDS